MKKWILTFTRERESIPEAYNTYEEAYSEMEKQYISVLEANHLRESDEINILTHSAWINDLDGENIDWDISPVEIDVDEPIEALSEIRDYLMFHHTYNDPNFILVNKKINEIIEMLGGED